jgi:hypothetical protein
LKEKEIGIWFGRDRDGEKSSARRIPARICWSCGGSHTQQATTKATRPIMQALDLETLIDRRFSSGEDADAEDVLRRTREAPGTRRKFDG